MSDDTTAQLTAIASGATCLAGYDEMNAGRLDKGRCMVRQRLSWRADRGSAAGGVVLDAPDRACASASPARRSRHTLWTYGKASS
jgi:hypothetical protein